MLKFQNLSKGKLAQNARDRVILKVINYKNFNHYLKHCSVIITATASSSFSSQKASNFLLVVLSNQINLKHSFF